VNVSRGDVIADLLGEIKALSNSGTGGNIEVKVYVGNKELKDITIETLRTDPRAQQVVRRVANV
jgi:hypothetical protein